MKQVFSFTAWRPNNLLAKSPFSPTTLGSNPSSGDSNSSPTDVQCCMMYVLSPTGTELM
ncbi:hypothetical protein HanXRQr2_Chr11g0484601 [Helianthus annuus]|uniref:Uncharacterized protein n=1 Tax=Helianthus annuus TaxID=4232 RepID=A0A251TA36_HELAN|nr:hypothetical protein HanXRQr2_Chr11g0484601 [Helianthus annuus]